MAGHVNVEGAEIETVEIRVRLGILALAQLRSTFVPCLNVWLTEQPDGSFALGVTTSTPPEESDIPARAVEVDDRAARFPEREAFPSPSDATATSEEAF